MSQRTSNKAKGTNLIRLSVAQTLCKQNQDNRMILIHGLRHNYVLLSGYYVNVTRSNLTVDTSKWLKMRRTALPKA
eukprot:3385879-Amphidinium_carterae.1